MNKSHLHRQMDLASQAKAQGNLEEAEEILQQVLDDYPQFAAAYNNLGALYFQQARWGEAIQSYRTAIEVQANYLEAYYNLGLTLTKVHRFEEAMTTYRALLTLVPEHFGANFQVARLLMQQEKYQAAIESLTSLAHDYPQHFETQANLATCFLRLGWLTEAHTHYLKALHIQPDDLQILFNLGVIAMQRGAVKDAITYYEQALQVNPDYFEAHHNVAIVLLGLKKPDGALYHLQQALRLHPQDEALKHIVGILLQDKSLSASPPAYIRSLFNAYADHYDAHLQHILHYQVPERLLAMVKAHSSSSHHPGTKLDILDLGCGTGLCGEVFKDSANTLTGVDLAEEMLAQADRKKLYDTLIQSDFLSYLQTLPPCLFDLIIAADVLVYFGDLQTIFPAVWRVLKPQGMFVWDTERGNQQSFELQETGRFAHDKKYLDALIQQTGFEVLTYEESPLRLHLGKPVIGHLYLLRKKN